MTQHEVVTLVCPPRLPHGLCKLIVGMALTFAVAAIDGTPDKQLASADRDNMIKLLLRNFPDETHREMLLANVERVLGHTADLTVWEQGEAQIGLRSRPGGR